MGNEAPSVPASAPPPGALVTAVKMWAQAYRVELGIFAVAFVVLAMFSSQRFLRQSAAPHFVYQAQSWLDGRLDIDAEVLPNIEDWACVRDVGGVRARCSRPPLPTDKWFSSFPAFPSVVMLPFAVIHGYQLNDTSFGVIVAALALAFFYSLLRLFHGEEGSARGVTENVGLTALLGFGTLFFYCSLRGEVWFSAEVMGVALTALYARNAVEGRHPKLAGLFFSMAVLTRTPLVFTGIFFLMEVICPTNGQRADELRAFWKNPKAKLEPLKAFALGALPLAALGALNNLLRFGSLSEFGHRFLFDNRVNADIDTYGLFSTHYLARNLDAAFLKLPLTQGRLGYDAWGLSLFLTLPFLALLVAPPSKPKRALVALGAMTAVLLASSVMPPLPGQAPVGERPAFLWLVLGGGLLVIVNLAVQWAREKDSPRLLTPLLVTIAACALPGLFYQNTGYAQFGFRFSLDYTPYLVLLLAVSGWSFKRPLPLALASLAVLVNFWGAVGFRGYTELVRGWM